MNCDILDFEVLKSVSPVTLMTYLSESGWTLQRRTDTINVYRKSFSESWDEVMVPNSNSYSDYPQMISMVLETLSKIESRAQRDIAIDIISGNVNDVLQYRLMMGDSSGTVPLDWMIQVLQAHKRMSAAAYLDIVDPKPYYGSLSSGNKALKDMRMGQTSYGSYVVRTYYPFTEPQRTVDGKYAVDGPIRKIVEKIMRSSRTIVESAADGVQIRDDAGISYNFVDSFMSLKSDGGFDFEMSCTGPRVRDYPPLTVPDRVFSRIENIIDGLKPKSIDDSRKFTGRLYAVQEREYDENISKFKLEYFDENGSAKASVVMDGHNRSIAMESLKNHSLVSLEGRLSGYGNSKTIEDVRDLHIVV